MGNALPGKTTYPLQGMTITGSPSSNQVLTATSSTSATWVTPATVPSPLPLLAGGTGVSVNTNAALILALGL